MSFLSVTNANGSYSQLMQLLDAPDIRPGSALPYQTCKVIFADHPLGARIAEKPIEMALSQRRLISVDDGVDSALSDAYWRAWDELGLDTYVKSVGTLARVYGVATLAWADKDGGNEKPLDLDRAANGNPYIAVFDPLNTAGSLVMEQDPGSPDFMKHGDIRVGTRIFHRSRCNVLMNEQPIYLDFTESSFGYVGRSAYQRGLFALRSFLDTQLTNQLIVRKAGVVVAKIKGNASPADRIAQVFNTKRAELLKSAQTGETLVIGHDDAIESLNLMNLEGPFKLARENIFNDIATAADLPAMILTQDSLVEGFGEGTEDAKQLASYVDSVRVWLKPVFDFLDPLVMRRAWNAAFFEAYRHDHEEKVGGRPYNVVFQEWERNFRWEWPSYLQETEAEKIKIDEARNNALIGVATALAPSFDPINKRNLFTWVADNISTNKLLFPAELEFDPDAFQVHADEMAEMALQSQQDSQNPEDDA